MIKHQAIDSTLVGLLNRNLKVKCWEMRKGKKLGGEREEKERKGRMDRYAKVPRRWLNYTVIWGTCSWEGPNLTPVPIHSYRLWVRPQVTGGGGEHPVLII